MAVFSKIAIFDNFENRHSFLPNLNCTKILLKVFVDIYNTFCMEKILGRALPTLFFLLKIGISESQLSQTVASYNLPSSFEEFWGTRYTDDYENRVQNLQFERSLKALRPIWAK